jgi:hypothetical protein
MKWLDNWLYTKVRDMWDNRDKYEAERLMKERDYKQSRAIKMNIGSAMVERSRPEGEDRISFELSSAVGGRILNVRRYDDRKDLHTNQTYVIPNGEDVGERVAKIINLEMFKG